MNSRRVGLLAVLLAVSVPLAFAQTLTDEKAVQKSIDVTINSAKDVHVKHVVAPSNSPKQVELVNGTVSNLTVADEQGQGVLFSVVGDNNGVVILPTKRDAVIEYDLKDVISQMDKVWTWDFRYLETTTFGFPKEVDLIFINGGPFYLGEKSQINCHGCQIKLEYSVNEPSTIKDVKWEEGGFEVEIRSHLDVDGFVFDQPAKSISFDFTGNGKYITAVIPLELLGDPYTVFLDDEKIPFDRDISEAHSWLSVKPETEGRITIIGTTVIPEFPIIAPLALGFMMILAMPLARRLSLR